MKNYLITILILALTQSRLTLAQNLVPNGGFENYTICPSNYGQIYRATGWFQPHKYPGSKSVNLSSSSDYFNTCAQANVGAPQNDAGYQSPMTGLGYIGIAYYTDQSNGNAYREYAEVILTQELIANKKYNLKYFVSLSNDSRFSITKFDAFLSNDSLLVTSSNLYLISVTPQIQYNARINDTLNWVEVTGTFYASGGERFLTLGNFHTGALSDTLRTPNSSVSYCCSAYYYIDDVSLELDTLTNIEESSIASFQLYPNPAKGIITITSPQLIQEIIVLDLSNKILFHQISSSASATIDLTTLDDGIYIVQCKFKNGAISHKKIVLQKD